MPIALEVTLILVLAALAVGLVPLLFQLRHTAQGLDTFLLSTTNNLAQIAEDVHVSRLRIDHLVGSLQTSLDELSTVVQLTGNLGRTLKDFHAHFHRTIEPTFCTLGGLIGGISAVLTFFKKKRIPLKP